MTLLYTIANTVLYLFGIYLLLNCCYLLFFSLAGHRKIEALDRLKIATTFRKICVLIPAYKEDAVILESAKAALAHPYSGEKEVVVIADGLQPETVSSLFHMGARVIEVNFERSTKGKALLFALSKLPKHIYDIAVVLDADNIMGKNCLSEINTAFANGYKVVQAHRTAKNTDTAFALLDACNEEINNHIYRKGQFAVGLSSALIGSGMAFQYEYLQKLLTGIGETVGEDKEIDFRIARDQVKIAYLHDVYVYDEKIENAQVFTNQRTRWIASQVEFMKKYAGEGITQLMKGNFEFFNKVLQAFLVPRMLLIGILGIFLLLSLVLPVGPSPLFWSILCVMLAASLLLGLPARLYNKQLWTAVIRLPYAILCMGVAMFRINKTKTSFLATPHKAKALPVEINN